MGKRELTVEDITNPPRNRMGLTGWVAVAIVAIVFGIIAVAFLKSAVIHPNPPEGATAVAHVKTAKLKVSTQQQSACSVKGTVGYSVQYVPNSIQSAFSMPSGVWMPIPKC